MGKVTMNSGTEAGYFASEVPLSDNIKKEIDAFVAEDPKNHNKIIKYLRDIERQEAMREQELRLKKHFDDAVSFFENDFNPEEVAQSFKEVVDLVKKDSITKEEKKIIEEKMEYVGDSFTHLVTVLQKHKM